jgi:peptidoglycan/xylan/chitin deacetylase (PgdA/CDA1 family)
MIWEEPPEAMAASGTAVFSPMPATILTYHKIGAPRELGITTVSRRRFTAHMDLLLGLDQEFLSASAAALGREAGLAVTFDDGYESVYREAFPEMTARGITGTVFPVAGAIGGWNDWDVRLAPRRVRHLSRAHLRHLAEAGFEIGSHSLTHRDLTKLSPETLGRELRDSKKIIEDATGFGVTAVSYPFGRYSRRVIDEAVAAGYTCGFTSFPTSQSQEMAMGRWAVHSIDGTGSLQRKVGVRSGRRVEWLKSRVIARLSLGTTLVKR